MLESDYLMDSLHCFNTDVPNWCGWKTHDDDGNKINQSKRMTYENVVILDKKAEMPTKKQVEDKIVELKNAEKNKATKKASAKTKLRDLGLDDDEISALVGE